MKLILFMLLTYLCGSVPFGKIVGHFYGIDIQRRGSGNIGFANVRRVLGWPAGLVTLACDIAKGILPVILGQQYFSRSISFWLGVAAIVGHLFPLWLRFRGGKGIATGFGIVAVLQPFAAAIGAAIYILGCLIWHNSSLGSVLGILAIFIAGSIIHLADIWMYGVLLLIALWTLRKNISGTVPNYDI